MNLSKPLRAVSRLLHSLFLQCRAHLPRKQCFAFVPLTNAQQAGICRIYVINLDRQPDRWADVLRELACILGADGKPLTDRAISILQATHRLRRAKLQILATSIRSIRLATSCLSNRYALLYGLADPTFPKDSYPRFEDAGKLMALASFSNRSTPPAEEANPHAPEVCHAARQMGRPPANDPFSGLRWRKAGHVRGFARGAGGSGGKDQPEAQRLRRDFREAPPGDRAEGSGALRLGTRAQGRRCAREGLTYPLILRSARTSTALSRGHAADAPGATRALVW